MTIAELEQLKKMSVNDRIKKYLHLKQNGKITLSQYTFIVNLPEVKPTSEPVVSEIHLSAVEPLTGSITENLIKDFGGHIVEDEPQKKQSQKARLLALLQNYEWTDTNKIQLAVYGAEHLGTARIGARVADLKKDGYTIESRNKSGSVWEYLLIKQEKLI